MKLMMVRTAGGERPAVQDGNEAVLLPDAIADLRALAELGDQGLALALEIKSGRGTQRLSMDGLELGPPLRRLRRDVLCCGWNYWDHFEESKGKREGQDVDAPKAPTFFTKGPDTIVGPADDVAYDSRISTKWDYEAEVALVIGKAGRSIRQENAREHILGLTLANDISQRDLQRRHGGQWLKGKSIDQTMPIGPMIVTLDEIDIPGMRLEMLLNGVVMQSALLKQMAFPIEQLVSELSFGMTLRPGDLVLTGTPSGIGNAREPQVFLKEGDVMTVRATGLGSMTNIMKQVDLAQDSDVVLN